MLANSEQLEFLAASFAYHWDIRHYFIIATLPSGMRAAACAASNPVKSAAAALAKAAAFSDFEDHLDLDSTLHQDG